MKFIARRWSSLALVAAVSTFGWGAAKPSKKEIPTPRPKENVIEGVTVLGAGRFAKVTIESTRALKYREVMTAKGQGLVIYFLEPAVSKRPAIEKVFHDLVEEVRFGYKAGMAPAPGGAAKPLDFIDIRSKEPVAFVVTQKENFLVAELRPAPRSSEQEDQEAGREIKSPEATPQVGLPSNPLLKDFLDVGLANHQPLKVAEREYSVSKFRYLEAMRNILPAATAKFSKSEGTLFEDPTVSTDNTKFKRKEYGFEFGIPIFHSGRNFYNYRSSAWQMQGAQQNIRKVKAEVTFEIVKAYYNLIKAQRSLKIRREMSGRAEKIIELARKKGQLGLITKADLLGAESLYSQGYYRLLSDEKDLEIARLKMASLLNMEQAIPDLLATPPDAVNPQSLVELGVPPESLVQYAYENRPDKLAADYAFLAQKFGHRAAAAANMLRVDGTYFLGRSGGAFESDDLVLGRSWSLGVQASLYVGGNTVKAASSKEHMTPDYAETTAQDVKAVSGSFALFDSFRSGGDARQAEASRIRAQYERFQARRNVEVDVREAYYNIQKAKIQIKGARVELDYRDKEMDIAQQKERMNMIEPQQTLAAENAYADAVSNYEEALAFYRISLAGLERAVGVPLTAIPEFR